MKNIKDLLIAKKEYVIEHYIEGVEGCFLFIEGLDEYGCTISNNEFNIEEVKNVLVELSDDCGYYIETLSDITLETTVETLKQKTLVLMGE